MKVAVIAHSGKTLGGGLLELRRTIEAHGVTEMFWAEVPKSAQAPAQVRRALKEGADLFFVWGGDGMVQHCVDSLAGTDSELAIVPAGTANLFATNLGIPHDIEGAVALGFSGQRHRFDLGTFNGEHFAVMAGVGFDAAMIKGAGGLKDTLGRAAYLWSGTENLTLKPFGAKVTVDGVGWFHGKATCVLFGNVPKIFTGVEAFEDSRPDDGLIELGVVTAEGRLQWARTIARTAVGSATNSPFVQTTKARGVKIELNRKVICELDGGDRKKIKKVRVTVKPAAIRVCVPQDTQ